MKSPRDSHFRQQAGCCAGLTTPATNTSPGETPELYDNTEAERTLLQLGATWREMTQQPGAGLPPEAAQLQQQQVRVINVPQLLD